VDVPTIINYLADFYTLEEIRAHRKQIGDALLGKVALPIVINQRSRDGNSSGGISLATNEECSQFMRACEAAEKRKNDDTSVDPSQLGTGIDFSYRPVLV
jgi:hypothetical protein